MARDQLALDEDRELALAAVAREQRDRRRELAATERGVVAEGRGGHHDRLRADARRLERLDVLTHHPAGDRDDQDRQPAVLALTRLPHLVVEEDLVPRQRDDALDLVLEHLGEVLPCGRRQDQAVQEQLLAGETEMHRPGLDLGLAPERRDRLGQVRDPLLRPRHRGERVGSVLDQRYPQQAFTHQRQGDVLGPDIDPEAVEEVDAADALREGREIHDRQKAGNRSYQRSM